MQLIDMGEIVPVIIILLLLYQNKRAWNVLQKTISAFQTWFGKGLP